MLTETQIPPTTTSTHLYVTGEGLVVDPLVLLLDAAEVDLGAAHDDPHQRLILRAGALHGGAEPLGEPRRRVLHTFHWKDTQAYIPGSRFPRSYRTGVRIPA